MCMHASVCPCMHACVVCVGVGVGVYVRVCMRACVCALTHACMHVTENRIPDELTVQY